MYSSKFISLGGNISRAELRVESLLQRPHLFFSKAREYPLRHIKDALLPDKLEETEEEIRGPNPVQGKTSSSDG